MITEAKDQPQLDEKSAWILYTLANDPEQIRSDRPGLSTLGRDQTSKRLREIFSGIAEQVLGNTIINELAKQYLDQRYLGRNEPPIPTGGVYVTYADGERSTIEEEFPEGPYDGTDTLNIQGSIPTLMAYLAVEYGKPPAITSELNNLPSYLLIGPKLPQR